jgi:hypothetical protein
MSITLRSSVRANSDPAEDPSLHLDSGMSERARQLLGLGLRAGNRSDDYDVAPPTE